MDEDKKLDTLDGESAVIDETLDTSSVSENSDATDETGGADTPKESQGEAASEQPKDSDTAAESADEEASDRPEADDSSEKARIDAASEDTDDTATADTEKADATDGGSIETDTADVTAEVSAEESAAVSERELLRDNLRRAEDKIDRAAANAEDLKKQREKEAAKKERDEAREREDAQKRFEREERAREAAAEERRAAMDYAENYRRRLREERENNAATKRREAEREAARASERENREREIAEELLREREAARARAERASELLTRVDGVVSSIETPPRVEESAEKLTDGAGADTSETVREQITGEPVKEIPASEPVSVVSEPEPEPEPEPDGDYVITVDGEDVGRDILYIEGGKIAEIKIPEPAMPQTPEPARSSEAEKPARSGESRPLAEAGERSDSAEPEDARFSEEPRSRDSLPEEPAGAMEASEELAITDEEPPIKEERVLRIPASARRPRTRRGEETDYDSLREFVKDAPVSDGEQDASTKAASLLAFDLERDKYTKKVNLERAGVPSVKRVFDLEPGTPETPMVADPSHRRSDKDDLHILSMEKKEEMLRLAAEFPARLYDEKKEGDPLQIDAEYPDTDKEPLTSAEHKRKKKEQKRARHAELLEFAEADKRARRGERDARIAVTEPEPIAEEKPEAVDSLPIEEVSEPVTLEMPEVIDYSDEPGGKEARRLAKKEKKEAKDALAGDAYDREMAEKETSKALKKEKEKEKEKEKQARLELALEPESIPGETDSKKEAQRLEKSKRAEQKAARAARDKNTKRQIKNDRLLIEHRVYSRIRELELEKKSAEVSYSSRMERSKAKRAQNKNASSLADARDRMKLAKKYEDADNDRYYALVETDFDTVKLPRKANREQLKAYRERMVELLRRRDELNIKLIELYSGASGGARGVAQGRFEAELAAKRKAYKQQIKLARLLERTGVGHDAKKRLYELMDRHTEIMGEIAGIDYSFRKEKPKGRAKSELVKQRKRLLRERKENLRDIERLKIKSIRSAKKRERARKNMIVGWGVLAILVVIGVVVYLLRDQISAFVTQFISGLGMQ